MASLDLGLTTSWPFLVTDRGCAAAGLTPTSVGAPSLATGPVHHMAVEGRVGPIDTPRCSGSLGSHAAGRFASWHGYRCADGRSASHSQRPRPPRRRGVQGCGHRRPLRAEGARAVLVCCTGGEEGDILNPAMDTPEVRDRHRRGAHARSCDRVGRGHRLRRGRHARLPRFGHARHRGQRRPRLLRPAPTSTRRSAGWWRSSARERPQVIITYGDDQEGYPHPDHLRVHEISVPAFDARRRSRPVPRRRRAVAAAEAVLLGLVAGRASQAMHEKFLELGLESPFDEKLVRAARRRTTGITTHIDVGELLRRARPARCWPTPPRSIPTSPFWFGLPRRGRRRRCTRGRTTCWPRAWSPHRAARGRPVRRHATRRRVARRTARRPGSGCDPIGRRRTGGSDGEVPDPGMAGHADGARARTPERPGATPRMQYVVTGAPDGDVKYYTVIENGKITREQLGEDADAEFTLTAPTTTRSRCSRASSTPTPRSCRGR